jgi:UDP-glucose 4-epimerase
VVRRYLPELDALMRRATGAFARIDRVYVNQRARDELGWRPRFDFKHVLGLLRQGDPLQSELATVIGAKGYHRPLTQPRVLAGFGSTITDAATRTSFEVQS